MKKIVNGKTYNTETAELIGEYWTQGIKRGDFDYYEETLYKTKNGHYFFFIFAGAHCIPKKLPDGNTTGMQFIQPVSEKDAQEWVENRKMR